MAKFRGFNNTTISVKKGLNRTQHKQVQRQIERNKRIKNSYIQIAANLTYVGPAYTYVKELTSVGVNGPDAIVRQTSQILLKSYNIKLGFAGSNPAPFRILICRSKSGPATDILSNTGPVANYFDQPDPDLYQTYVDEIHTNTLGGNQSLGYLLHMYKSFKKKNVPHMVVGYNDTTATPDASVANKNPIIMKIIMNEDLVTHGVLSFAGFCHVKFFDKE